MATLESGSEGVLSRALGFLTRYAFVAAFTGVETAALAAWLALVEGAATVSQVTAIGLGVLLVGLVVEHVLTDVAVNGADLSVPVGPTVFVSATETALWGLWLLVAERVGGVDGILVAGVVLAVLLVPQHSVEDSALRGRGLFSRLLNVGTLGFSVIEAAGATLWLLFVREGGEVQPLLAEVGMGSVDPAVAGVGLLAASLFVEHVVGVAFSRRN